MRKTCVGIMTAASILVASNSAFALFTNGGFETGDTSGWTVDSGNYTGNNVVNWAASGYGSGSGRADVIDNTGTMSGQTLDVNPYSGNYMVRINDIFGSNDATKISQTDTISQQDIDDGAMLYVNWGAMLIEPQNQHPDGAQPYFNIDVLINGTAVESFSANALNHNSDSSWVNAGFSDGNLWYKSDVWSFDLSTYSLGDSVTISMWVTDCDWGGHGGYAFLDGIGTVNPSEVPEPSTLLLFGAGLAGLLGARRRNKK